MATENGWSTSLSEQCAFPLTLFRFQLIAEATNPAISAAERGLIVRGLAAFAHPHPDGTLRSYSRGTLDRWVRAYRARGLAGLMPVERSDTGVVRRHPELRQRRLLVGTTGAGVGHRLRKRQPEGSSLSSGTSPSRTTRR